jgi:hypothetical protein
MVSSGPPFFPYDPRALRRALFACAAVSALLGGWTLAQAWASREPLGFARGGLLVALLIAFGWFFWRIRPREGWGVRIDALGVTISRPLSGDPWRLVWSQLSGVVREGARRERLALLLRPEGKVLLPRRLFGSQEVFDALRVALEDRLPRQPHDA